MDENKTYTLKIYNTLTDQYEEVAVSEKVYKEFRRTKWEIENKDRSYYTHEIQMSALIGGENEQYENFREFIDSDNTPEKLVLDEIQISELKEILKELSEEERHLILSIYFKGMTEFEYAKKIGVTQQNISKKKKRILMFLKNFFE